ncbi:MAG: septum formation initiator family protein [Rickettsiales bacterium]|nr:septum formation initiator family protein [Rickettsiales bacterium]
MYEEDDLENNNFHFQKILSIIFTLLLILYVLYHLYNGHYGFKSYITKQHRINQKNIEFTKIENDVTDMKNKIENLQDNNLDSDILDEEIRKNTGYAKENEIIIYSDDLEKGI